MSANVSNSHVLMLGLILQAWGFCKVLQEPSQDLFSDFNI